MFICTCICVYIYIYICRYVRTCISMYICMYIYIHTCIYIYMYIYICIHVCTYIYIYACIYIHIYVTIHVYMFSRKAAYQRPLPCQQMFVEIVDLLGRPSKHFYKGLARFATNPEEKANMKELVEERYQEALSQHTRCGTLILRLKMCDISDKLLQEFEAHSKLTEQVFDLHAYNHVQFPVVEHQTLVNLLTKQFVCFSTRFVYLP